MTNTDVLFKLSGKILLPNVERVFNSTCRLPVREEKENVKRHRSSGQLFMLKRLFHPLLRGG
jgi:hypothetical protein